MLVYGEEDNLNPNSNTSPEVISYREETSVKNRVIWNISICLVIISSFFIFYELTESNILNILERKTKLLELGYFEKHLLYDYYYGLKITKDQDEDYSPDYEKELRDFYRLSGKVYPELGDPTPTLKRSYIHVELLNSIIHNKIYNLTEDQSLKFIEQVEEALLQSGD